MNSIFDIDPFGSYPLNALLKVTTTAAPHGFDAFWQKAYHQALSLNPTPILKNTGKCYQQWKIYDLSFISTQLVPIKGWLLVPAQGEIRRAFVVGHGYGGREGPDFHLPFPDAAIFFPCCRGLSRSAIASISQDPYWHVLHDIDKKEQYVLRGCVEDIWLSVSVIERLYPKTVGNIGLLGISFCGGIGMLALAQDSRIAKAHFNVPTFGHYSLRLRIPTNGSGKALQNFYQRAPYKLIRTLRYYDAAYAATRVTVPVHCALALRDPIVTPPGQFAIYNQIKTKKQLYVLEAGHDDYPNKDKQFKALNDELFKFFSES